VPWRHLTARPPWRTVAVFALAGLASVALSMCGNDNVTEPPDAGANDDSPAQCKLAEPNPATITVTSSTGVAIPCQASLSVVSANGTPSPICGTVGNPCEIGVVDAGVGECPYTVYVSGTSASPVTVVVSQPGFETQDVPHVFDGLGGCVATPTPGSQSAVVLVPNGTPTDAGMPPGDASDASDAADAGDAADGSDAGDAGDSGNASDAGPG
jgi:hypothetical protein